MLACSLVNANQCHNTMSTSSDTKKKTDEPKKGKEKGSPMSCHATPLHPPSTALASVISPDAPDRAAPGPARLNGPQRHWPECYKYRPCIPSSKHMYFVSPSRFESPIFVLLGKQGVWFVLFLFLLFFFCVGCGRCLLMSREAISTCAREGKGSWSRTKAETAISPPSSFLL